MLLDVLHISVYILDTTNETSEQNYEQLPTIWINSINDSNVVVSYNDIYSAITTQ